MLLSEGWQPRSPLDDTDHSTAEATVWGGRIQLYKVARSIDTQAPSRRASELTLFLQHGGGNVVEARIETWASVDEQRAELDAALDVLESVLPRLGVDLPTKIRDAIALGETATRDSGALRFKVSPISRAMALMTEPDLDPASVPTLSIKASIRDWEPDEDEYDD